MSFMRLIGAGLIALLTTGCAIKYRDPDGKERSHFFFQRGIVLQVTHTCTPVAMVYQAGRGLVGVIRGERPHEFPLEPVIWGGGGEIIVTIQSIDSSARIVGTYIESFDIDYESTTARAWVISDRAQSYGGWRVRHSNCGR